MTTNSNNALRVKRKLRPKDYKRDPNCRMLNRKSGKMVTIPVILIQAVRAGQLRLVS